MEKMIRKWGYYEDLDVQEKYKIRKLVFNPGDAISRQYHMERSETWIIISGIGFVRLEEEDTMTEMEVGAGDIIEIPVGTTHKVYNLSEENLLVALELQRGNCTDDDIIRIDDEGN